MTVLRPIPRLTRIPTWEAGTTRRDRMADTVPASVRLATDALLVTIFLLPQFGINVAGASLPFSLPAYLVLTGTLAIGRLIAVNALAMIAYGGIAAVGLASLTLNGGPSTASLALLLVLYAPFCLAMNDGRSAAFRGFARDRFILACVLVSLVGVVQFVLQFLPGARGFLDIRTFIPAGLRLEGKYNTFAFTGGLLRSNGFFLLEPSSLSLYAGLGLVEEMVGRKRPWMIASLLTGMFVALSGSGLLVVGIALLAFAIRRGPVAVLVSMAALALLPIVGRWVGLSFLVDRLAEIGSPRSSGYARFVAPLALVDEGWSAAPWSAALGNGPGAILRVIQSRISAFEIFDPTWAKILLEYGAIGIACFCAFLVATIGRTWAPAATRTAIVYAWAAAGGLLVQANFVALMPLLVTWWRFDGPASLPRRHD